MLGDLDGLVVVVVVDGGRMDDVVCIRIGIH